MHAVLWEAKPLLHHKRVFTNLEHCATVVARVFINSVVFTSRRHPGDLVTLKLSEVCRFMATGTSDTDSDGPPPWAVRRHWCVYHLVKGLALSKLHPLIPSGWSVLVFQPNWRRDRVVVATAVPCPVRVPLLAHSPRLVLLVVDVQRSGLIRPLLLQTDQSLSALFASIVCTRLFLRASVSEVSCAVSALAHRRRVHERRKLPLPRAASGNCVALLCSLPLHELHVAGSLAHCPCTVAALQ